MHRTEIADAIVRATASPESDLDDPRTWSWVAASVWTDRMLAALGNGVRGGKWHSLIDKVYAPQTLQAAWQRVKSNRGAAGIDRMSIERFEANASRYLAELEQRLREKTGRTRSASLETIITELNPILKGWFGYFQHAHRSTFRDVDGFVRRRLRAILRKREKRPGFGRTPRDHIRWPNAFFAKHGLFTLQDAHVLASQSR